MNSRLRRSRGNSGFTIGEALLGQGCGLLVIGVISFLFGAWLWTYSVNTALGWAHRPQVFPWWGGGLLGIVPGLGQISPAVAAIVWVANLFVK